MRRILGFQEQDFSPSAKRSNNTFPGNPCGGRSFSKCGAGEYASPPVAYSLSGKCGGSGRGLPYLFLLYVVPEHHAGHWHECGHVEAWARVRGDLQIGLLLFNQINLH